MTKQDHQLGDGPIEDRYREQMNALAEALDRILNGDDHGKDRKVGFALLVFNFGSADGRCNYISNADRNCVVTMLREQLARFEGQAEMKGTG
jgi:hypothetical protein